MNNFKFVKFLVSIFFLTDLFFNFQFCDDHILDFIEAEHIVMKQSLPIYIIFYVKYTEISDSHAFSGILRSETYSFYIWIRWKVNPIIIKRIPPGTYLSPELIHIFTQEEEVTNITCLVAVCIYGGVFNFHIKQLFVAVYDSVDNFILEWLQFCLA